jgi:hypothetical protein
MANSMEHKVTGKTPNGSDWPMNYADHTQAEMDYAWRSPGSWTPDNLKSGPRHAKRPDDPRPHVEDTEGFVTQE